MWMRVYLVRRTTIDEIQSFLTNSGGWTPQQWFENIHFFTKKSLAEASVPEAQFPDYIEVIALDLEFD